MAKKLNKNLIIVLVLTGLAIVVIGVIIFLQQRYADPQPFIDRAANLIKEAKAMDAANEAEAAKLATPREVHDRLKELAKETSEPKYKDALEMLQKAYGFALRRHNAAAGKDALTQMADLYWQQKKYNETRGVWAKMIQDDAQDVAVRKKLTNYMYELAKSGALSVWPEVKNQADGLIQLNDQRKEQDATGYLMKAHAMLGMIIAGTESDPEGTYSLIADTLTACEDWAKSNPLWYDLQGQLAQLQAKAGQKNSQGQDLWLKQAEEYYSKGVANCPEDPQAYLNKLEHFQIPQWQAQLGRAERLQIVAERTNAMKKVNVERDQLEKQVRAMVAKFPNDGRFYVRLAGIISGGGSDALDRAIELYGQAVACPGNEAMWHGTLADFYLKHAQEAENKKPDLESAAEILRRVLYHPDIIQLNGPREPIVKYVRYRQVLPLLVETMTLLAKVDSAHKEGYMREAEAAHKELADAFPANDPFVRLSAGRLAVARGDTEEGINEFYQADNLFNAQKAQDQRTVPDAKRELFFNLRGTARHNLAIRYGIESLYTRDISQAFLLEVIESLMDQPRPEYLASLQSLIAAYENLFGSATKNYPRVLMAKATLSIRVGQFDEARKVLEKLPRDTELWRLLWAQAQDTTEKRVALLKEILKDKPAHPAIVPELVRYYMQQGVAEASRYDQAKALLAAALKVEPQNVGYLHLQKILGEPDPQKISTERSMELTREVFEGLGDPFEKALRLAQFYRQKGLMAQGRGDTDVMKADFQQSRKLLEQARNLKPEDQGVNRDLYSLMLGMEDWPAAQDMISQMQKNAPLDALLFEADLMGARREWNQAADRLERYLEKRPLSPAAHLSLARVYMGLELPAKALEQAQMAVLQDDQNASAFQMVASLLHQRYAPLGPESLSESQLDEMIRYTEGLLRQAPGDLMGRELRVMYYPVMLDRLMAQLKVLTPDSEDAKLTRQKILHGRQIVLETCRSLVQDNPQETKYYTLLAATCERLSRQTTEEKEKQSYLQQAEQALKEGLTLTPDSAELASMYSSFLQMQGRGPEAEAFLQGKISSGTGGQQRQAKLILSRNYVQQGDFDRAVEVLKELLTADPKDQDALVEMGTLYKKQGKYAEGAEFFGQARRLGDSEQRAALQVETVMQAGNLEQGKKLLEEMKQAYPNYFGTLLLEANMEILNTNYDRAIELANKTLANDSRNVAAYLIKNNALYFKGNYQESMQCLTELRGIVGKDSLTTRLPLAKTYWMLKRYEEALVEVRAVVTADATSIEARQLLVNMLKNLRRWAELENVYLDLLKKYPQDVGLYMALADNNSQWGMDYFQQKQQSRGAEQYLKAVERMRQAYKLSQETKRFQGQALNGLMQALLNMGDKTYYEEVIKLVEANLTGQPEDALALGRKAEALYRIGQKEAALATFEQAMDKVKDTPSRQEVVLGFALRVADVDAMLGWTQKKLAENPQWRTLHLLLALLYQQKNMIPERIKELETAREGAEPDLQIAIDSMLSAAYLQINDNDKAIDVYKRMVAADPQNAPIINNLAYLLLQQPGREKEALQTSEKAYALNDADANIMDTYALALIQTGSDYDKAEWLVRRALQQVKRDNQPVLPEYYYHLGLALKGRGEKGDALAQFRAALDRLREMGAQVGDAEVLRKNIEKALDEMGQ